MNSSLSFLLIIFTLASCGSDDFDPDATAPLVAAYDTLEIEYQKLGDLADELVANVSVNAGVSVAALNNALEREPVVSLDFNKPVTTKKDISNFVRHQQRLQAEFQKLISKLEQDPAWKASPLLPEIRLRYQNRLDSILLASDRFNSVATKSAYDIRIPVESNRAAVPN